MVITNIGMDLDAAMGAKVISQTSFWNQHPEGSVVGDVDTLSIGNFGTYARQIGQHQLRSVQQSTTGMVPIVSVQQTFHLDKIKLLPNSSEVT